MDHIHPSILPPPVLPSQSETDSHSFVSRAGVKLQAAIKAFGIDLKGRICADLGANVGGFTDCLLQHGATKVYAVDTAYGVLAWNLRKDPRVVVRDRTNALHVKLPELVSLVAVDVGWTRQEKVLPAAERLIALGGEVLSLVKPHYESSLAGTQRGVLSAEQSLTVLHQVLDHIAALPNNSGSGPAWRIKGIVQSPLEGHKGNVEYVLWLGGIE